MYSSVYREPRSFSKYDDERFIVYINEEIIEDYQPAPMGPDMEVEPYTGYQYTGTLIDGGYLIDCKNAERNELINGIIRTHYTQSEEDAIKTHMIEMLRGGVTDKAETYEAEWNEFNEFRTYVIGVVDKWLA